MPDPTPEPTQAPTPAPTTAPTPAPAGSLPSVQPFDKVAVGVGGGEFIATPTVVVSERGDRAEGTEISKAEALDKGATAHQRVADALAQVAEMASSPDSEMTPAWLYRDARLALLRRADVPFDDHHKRASQVVHDIENYAAGQRW